MCNTFKLWVKINSSFLTLLLCACGRGCLMAAPRKISNTYVIKYTWGSFMWCWEWGKEEKRAMSPAEPKPNNNNKKGKTGKGEERNTEALDTAQNKTDMAPCGQIHSRRGMERQESWLLRLSSFQCSHSWKRRATWEERKKEGGGTKISSKFLQLLLSWAGLFSQSLHPEPCYHSNAVTAYSEVSAAEPENVTEEVQFPGLLTWKIYI